MKKSLVLFVLLLGTFLQVAAQPRRAPRVQKATLDWLRQRLNVREATRYPGNDGPAVAAIIRAGGGNPAEHPEHCGFTQAADQRAHGLPIPANGLQGAARYWFVDDHRRPLSRTFYYAGRLGSLDSIRPGDLVGMAWQGSGGVIHHITRVDQPVRPLRKGRPARAFYCIGGNEGHYPNAGMHRTLYWGVGALAAAARWDYK